jgi:hypothetical protein
MANGKKCSYPYSGNTLKMTALIFLLFSIVQVNGTYADIVKIRSGDSVSRDSLGHSVSISGEYAIVGAPGPIGDSGTAQIFSLSARGWIRQVKLTASDAAPGDKFGSSVSMSGDYAIVGAPGDSTLGPEAGAAYVYFRKQTGWVLQAKLTPSDGEPEDLFGFSVQMDRDTAIIGSYRSNAPGADAGSAYIFVRRGTDWIQQARLIADDAKSFEWLGYAVAISGNTAIIGAIRSNTTGEDSGAAYIFVRNGDIWVQQAKLVGDNIESRDNFGFSVAISGDIVVVGSPNNTSTGSAYIFERVGAEWIQRRNRVRLRMFPYDPRGKGLIQSAASGFGYSVAITGKRIIIGSKSTKIGTDAVGAAYIFVPDEGTFWKQSEQLVASNGKRDDQFGAAVDIGEDFLIVGAPSHSAGGPDSGVSYIFGLDENGWTQRAILVDQDTAIDDRFGGAVSISGNTAIVGAQENDDAGSNAGAAYVFVRHGTNWALQAKLSPNKATLGDLFGCAVSISGNIALIGACGDDDNGPSAGAAYVFMRQGINWIQEAKLIADDTRMFDQFGASVAIDGTTAIVGASGSDNAGENSGAAYIFMSNGNGWTQQAKLTSDDAITRDLFGFSVSISGDTAIVGAHQNDAAGPNSGAAYVFTRNGTRWTQQIKLHPDDGGIEDEFGFAVAIHDNLLIVGARKDDHAEIDAGSAYIFIRSDGDWIQDEKIVADDAGLADEFGVAVAINGNRVLVGAWKDNHPLLRDTDDPAEEIDKGSVYPFLRSGFFWTRKERIIALSPIRYEHFGVAVAISRNFAIVGGPGNDEAGSDAGAAYIFNPRSLNFILPNESFSVEPSSHKLTSLGQIKRSSLLQNYPNPFNPETWIPYRLAMAAHVEISIYDIAGNHIRTLQLGLKPRGEHTVKDEAAYWNGRSDTGERVSSGIYFYRLSAGNYSATRRMVIVE